MTMVKVYFEIKHKYYADLVAVFEDESVYEACSEALEKHCKETGFDFVTESVEHEDKELKDLFD